MKCVILAAGKGTRMLPLTKDIPKPLLKILDKTLIEYVLSSFPKDVKEFIVVTGYLGEKIQRFLGRSYGGRPITYVKQREPKGTYHAISLVRPHLKEGERFFVVGADDLHGKEAISRCLKYERAIVVAEVEDPRPYGVILTDKGGKIVEIIEKPEKPKSKMVSTGLLLLDDKIFDFEPVQHSSGEYYLTSALEKMLPLHPIYVAPSSFWFPVSTPEDLKRGQKIVAEAFSC